MADTAVTKKKILIIDDEAEICLLTKSILERTGNLEVAYSSSGKDGLRMAQSYKPDLIILDILIPDLDGTSIASQILAIPALQHTRIMFLSALVQGEEVQKSMGIIGGYEFLSKPLNARDLVERVEAAVGAVTH